MNIAALMSIITWMQGMLLFVFQSYIEGWSWFSSNLNIETGVFAGSWIWIILITLLTMASSAWVRLNPLAAWMVVGVFFVLFAMSRAINLVYQTEWGDLLNLFFFSSRRRHTRCLSDWSSDVCSSDLTDPRSSRESHQYSGRMPCQSTNVLG